MYMRVYALVFLIERINVLLYYIGTVISVASNYSGVSDGAERAFSLKMRLIFSPFFKNNDRDEKIPYDCDISLTFINVYARCQVMTISRRRKRATEQSFFFFFPFKSPFFFSYFIKLSDSQF